MTANTFFSNFLSSERITTTRLRNFAESSENRFIGDNATKTWDAVLAYLSPAIAAVSEELGDVDAAVNTRVGRTMTVDEQIAAFKAYMSDREPFVADALGGRATPAYLEFYPQGITEYRAANKTTMPLLVRRVGTAATAHAAQLGTALTAALQAWEGRYDTSRDAQQGQKESVDDNRSERTDARKALEVATLRALHTVGEKYPGDVQKCSAYFEFERLLPQPGGQPGGPVVPNP